MKIQSNKSFALDLPGVEPQEAGKSETKNTEAKKKLDPESERKLAEADKVAQDFETMFVDMMLKSMRATAKREDMSNAEDIFQGMLDSEYAKGMSGAQDFGIRGMVTDWIKANDPQLRSLKDNQQALETAKEAQRATKQAIEQYRIQAATFAKP